MSFLVSWEVDGKQFAAKQYLQTCVKARLVQQEIERLDVCAVPCASRSNETGAKRCKRAFLVTMMRYFEILVKLAGPRTLKLEIGENLDDLEVHEEQEKFSWELLKLWSNVGEVFAQALSMPDCVFEAHFDGSGCALQRYPAACMCVPLEGAVLGGFCGYSANWLVCIAAGSGLAATGVGCAIGLVTAVSIFGLTALTCYYDGLKASGEFASRCDHLDSLFAELQGREIAAEDVAEMASTFKACFKASPFSPESVAKVQCSGPEL
mmetsp:Transcript_43928/g.116096  ORF Transcript_43928/g.116096 Transcript_43928/m.116096 type:complete len:265 (-) Transcript_43928:253-1047(-)